MKLTNQMRDDICDRLVEATFRERHLAVIEAEMTLAQKLRDMLLTPEQIKAVDALPRKFFVGDGQNSYGEYRRELLSKLYIYVAHPEKSNSYVQVYFGQDVRVPAFIHGIVHKLEADDPFWDEIKAWKDAKNTLEKEESEFLAQTEGVLKAFPTVEKLLEAWPTIKDVMPKDFFTPLLKPQLPMQTVNALDEKLKSALKVAA